jgi:hypothetical protein
LELLFDTSIYTECRQVIDALSGTLWAFIDQSVRWILNISDDGYNSQNYWGFGLDPLSSILKTREHSISETGCFHSQMKGEDICFVETHKTTLANITAVI